MRITTHQLLTGLLATALTTTTTAQKVNLHEITAAQNQYKTKEHAMASPFLSATLKTSISPISTFLKPDQKQLLSSSLVEFLQHVFDDQQVFDVEIVGVAIFEEQLVNGAGDGVGGKRRLVMQKNQQNHRKLPLNALQKGQFHFATDDEYEKDPADNGDTNKEAESWGNNEDWDELKNLIDKKKNPKAEYTTLTFATVVSAEHQQQQNLSHGDFQNMLIHICHKFDTHLVEFVKGIEDGYFGDVESVVVSGYEVETETQEGDFDGLESQSRKESEKSKWSAASIVAIVLSVLLLVPLAFAIVKFRRKEQQVNTSRRWRSQEIATANNVNNLSIKSLRVLYSKPQVDDDYSFDPLGTDNGYTGNDIPRMYSDTVDSCGNSNQPLGTSSTSSLFQQPYMDEGPNNEPSSATIKAASSPPISQQEHQHIYAPPGKVGVAIDVVNSNPIVHKVKKGSPLQGLLQPNDLVMAIDDIDTTCMSAADVTHLMVKRMNYQRKITFVRRNE